jgi:para-aminobenzoate synthetase/4-amino-4-deoxychorismate lyase
VPGTVSVDPLYEIVTTPYCHHLVSRVHGVLQPEATFAQLLSATFPSGSVTGAPKRAAMRISGELEASPRGAYCGALLVARRGELDSSVLIRTLEGIAENPSLCRFGTGCGITYDSDPAAEHLEALLKASLATGDEAPTVSLRETMRVVSGRVPLLDRHLARLASGGTGPTLLARAREEVASTLASATTPTDLARLGLTVNPDRRVAAHLTPFSSSLAEEGGVVLAPVEVSTAPRLPCGAAKPADRQVWDDAHRRATALGANQAVLHTRDGVVIDGSTATIWLVADARLSTPPAPPAVAGVARGLVLDLAASLGVPAEERQVTLAELDRADEVFVSNALGLVVPVRDRSGPLSATLAAAVRDAVGGTVRW